ncbi:glycoside hydrolase family 3 C-terminal domain-containing protein [Paenibacillus sp. ISL-20]|uniref:beta-glucosidase family protein n=1 Tax=Paenibacillus sp. ISL-20 TaxID=2819163 RepID=UPI001BEADA22|nr:glycoside hydrolase family 3 C-terminal domain-containing protein [Paenibacillus sp. ISL-20]MBT2761369.1 glycoside hydrolase family 3 C-terminal domain-containing protein [Paenibacillus sp. ISL-20]
MSEQRDLKALISQMTLEEKASLCSGLDNWHTKGVERLGIPSVMVTDGPHGLRKQRASSDHLGLFDSVPATCFPSAAGVASSWNRDLIYRMGEALGIECQAENVAVLLGPGANIKRSPLCGRNFEYFSEDPYLSTEMATHHIRGVQSQGVGTSLKHFAANNQEHRRMTSDSVVDERTLREIYLASFEGAVKQAQPWTVMCSYNKVNGEFASENETLLTDILKNEWGHEGFVISDWGAVNERAKALAAGMELEMPSSHGEGDAKIVEAVRSGQLPEGKLDAAVERLLTVIFKAVDQRKPDATFDQAEHHRLAREVAQESMVLLKNEGGMLPLARSGRIAVIGALAKEPRYQGSGSSKIRPTRVDDILEELEASSGDAQIHYAPGYKLNEEDSDQQLLQEALAIASEATVAVVFAGLPNRYESEGFDRKHLRFPPNQIALIEAVAKVQPNLAVVLSNGAPVEMPWLGESKAVLEAYLGGQAIGGAIADILFGDANPSGKLAETFPVAVSDNPSYLFFPGEGDRVEYREGLFVGYRYYDTKKLDPLFPFGHGLSYTTFEYSKLTVNKKRLKDTEKLTVTVNVKNTGARPGKEIVQLYVHDMESSVIRPEQELKGFDKVELAPGEAKTIIFELDHRSFAYYDIELKDWVVESGDFEIRIGKSSRDIVLTEIVEVESTTDRQIVFHRNSTVSDLKMAAKGAAFVEDFIGKLPFASALEDGSNGEMFRAFLDAMPLRGLLSFSGGKTTEKQLSDLIDYLNS